MFFNNVNTGLNSPGPVGSDECLWLRLVSVEDECCMAVTSADFTVCQLQHQHQDDNNYLDLLKRSSAVYKDDTPFLIL